MNYRRRIRADRRGGSLVSGNSCTAPCWSRRSPISAAIALRDGLAARPSRAWMRQVRFPLHFCRSPGRARSRLCGPDRAKCTGRTRSNEALRPAGRRGRVGRCGTPCVDLCSHGRQGNLARCPLVDVPGRQPVLGSVPQGKYRCRVSGRCEFYGEHCVIVRRWRFLW